MAETEIIFSFRTSPEGGYEARALGHSIFTQADTMDELRAMVKDAVACHFGDTDTLHAIRLVESKRFRVGSAKGVFTVSDDFNDPPPEEIEDLFWE